jgi:hypothetical protein
MLDGDWSSDVCSSDLVDDIAEQHDEVLSAKLGGQGIEKAGAQDIAVRGLGKTDLPAAFQQARI